eukprot:2272066-Pyramimonas_sp.AAC.1
MRVRRKGCLRGVLLRAAALVVLALALDALVAARAALALGGGHLLGVAPATAAATAAAGASAAGSLAAGLLAVVLLLGGLLLAVALAPAPAAAAAATATARAVGVTSSVRALVDALLAVADSSA